MSWNLSSLVNTLTSAGVTETALTSAVSALAGMSPNAKIQAGLTTILANSANPAVIADEVKQIAEIPSVPAAVLNLLPALSAATSPTQVVQMVQAIETVMSGSGLTIG
jgi:hypothetical protein